MFLSRFSVSYFSLFFDFCDKYFSSIFCDFVHLRTMTHDHFWVWNESVIIFREKITAFVYVREPFRIRRIE